MARYIVKVYTQDGRPVDILGPVNFISTARQFMLKHAGLTHLPEREPSTRSDLLEVWVIGEHQYRIQVQADVLVSSVQAVAAFG